ncbi:MAG: tetratricopeptide repeat protein [Promethearchaeota archaeon]
MSQLELDEIKRLEELFDKFRIDEALEYIDELTQLNASDLEKKSFYQLTKGQILGWQGKYEEAIKFGKKMFEEGQKSKEDILSINGLRVMATGYIQINKFSEALGIIEKAEEILNQSDQIPEKELIKLRSHFYVGRGHVNYAIDNVDLAFSFINKVLNLNNEFVDSHDKVWAYLVMSYISNNTKKRYDLALEHTNKALSIAKKMNFNHFWIAAIHLFYGVVYTAIGEVDLSLENSLESLRIFKGLKNKHWIALLKNNVGLLYSIKGNNTLALKYLEESLILFKTLPMSNEICLDSIIFVALENNDMKRAQKYFNQLEELYNQKKNGKVKQIYQYNKALMLKRSNRIRDKVKAEELLKEVIKIETLNFDTNINALVQLCDLLLTEFSINNEIEVLDELNMYISQLLSIAENSRSYFVFCQTFILQAKLSLVKLDLKGARRFLTQAQKIAESFGIKSLAMKISYEHDELLKQLNIWEELKKSETSLPERVKLARLNEHMGRMLKKQSIEIPEVSDEEPVLLLIVSEGGMPFFSQSFIEDKSFEDHLLGGFFTAINSFINEKFSEGLDRASFGEHTLLMNSVSPFLMCYVYKGQSFSAQNRIRKFIDKIQTKKDVWDTFLKFHQMNKEIQIKDIPLLKPLIAETFIVK